MKKKILSFSVLPFVTILFLLTGCQTQSPRLPVYLGPAKGLQKAEGQRPSSLPTALREVGVLVLTDSSSPNSAPPLSPGMLQILENRVVVKMEKYFGLKAKTIRFEQPLQPPGDVSPFMRLSKAHNLDFILVTLFSSTEEESHAEIGEETVMTRMSGVVIDNDALAELALLNADSGNIEIHASGQGLSSMEQLAVPLGENYPGKEEARDIMRANAAEKALDQALLTLKRQWSQSLVTGG